MDMDTSSARNILSALTELGYDVYTTESEGRITLMAVNRQNGRSFVERGDDLRDLVVRLAERLANGK